MSISVKFGSLGRHQVSSRNNSSVNRDQAHQTPSRRSQGVWECLELPPGCHTEMIMGTGLRYGDCEVDFQSWSLLRVFLGSILPWWVKEAEMSWERSWTVMQTKPRPHLSGAAEWDIAALGEGGLSTWATPREGTLLGAVWGTSTSALKWGMDLDGARRFYYRVEARSKEEVPLYP